MDVFKRYPIYPVSCFLLYASYLLPVGLLITVLQRSSIQSNCRVILTFWALGMVGILTVEMYLMFVNMTPADGEFISKKLQDPPHRPMIHVFHSIFYLCTSALEFLIAIERTFAMRSANSTGEPRSVYWYLVPYLAAWLTIGWITGRIAFLEFNMIVISVIYITVEISSILLNLSINIYSKRRYAKMFGQSSLTERYQIREIFTLSSAMFPVNVCGFSIKFTAAIVCWIYSLYYEQLPYFVLEFFYQTLHATNCAVCAILLMSGHIRMRKETLKILQMCCRSIKIRDDTTNSSKDGNAYFAMLSQSWN